MESEKYKGKLWGTSVLNVAESMVTQSTTWLSFALLSGGPENSNLMLTFLTFFSYLLIAFLKKTKQKF